MEINIYLNMRKPNYRGWIFTKTVAIYTHYGKPLYGSVFGLAEEPLLYTIKNNLYLIIKTIIGTATYKNPKVWLENNDIGEGIFKRPNSPLKFYYKAILPDIKAREERKKQEEKQKEKKILTLKGASKMLSAWKEVLKNKSVRKPSII